MSSARRNWDKAVCDCCGLITDAMITLNGALTVQCTAKPSRIRCPACRMYCQPKRNCKERKTPTNATAPTI